jgi:two-component system, NtrC family, sensor histidine kinase HydH
MNQIREGRLGRIGWLITTLALALALIAGAWANFMGARASASTLNRGQADLLEAAVRDNFMQETTPLHAETLAQILATHGDAGLRYIAVFDTAGTLTMSAGDPELPPAPPTEPTFGRQPLEPVGDRVRFYMTRPPTFVEIAAQDSIRRERAPNAARRVPPQRRWVLIEMDPVLASTLESRAARSLILSIAGATILAFAALLFWRISEKYQSALLRLEEQRRLTLLGEMSAVLAHEIRNPLASLKGNAQLLAERLADGSREQARAERVVGEATRLEALTSDLLDFARSGSLTRHAADPVDVLHHSISDVAADGFDVDTAAAPAEWTFDAERIRQTLVNVLQNARQASPAGSRPRVRVATEGRRLVYEVRDFGPGLAPDTASRIFDPFFTTRTNGTGLGLAVARRAAELHGGSVTARNHEQGGALFRIEIPAGD